jgi:uncharacterized protein (UPF0332 family)
MTTTVNQEYLNYRIEQAFETLNAAKVLINNRFWNSSVNRLYYASFYAISALLLKYSITAKTHSTVKSQFSLQFIKTGILDKKYGILYSDLFDWRQKGDYSDFFDLSEDAVVSMIEPVEELLEEIKMLLMKE